MKKDLIGSVCDVSDNTPVRKKVGDSKDIQSVSVSSFLSDARKSSRVEDSAASKEAFKLLKLNRTDRRRSLSKMTDSVRRRTLAEMCRLRRKIADSAFDPELTWAVDNYRVYSDADSEEILEKRLENNTLPKEVIAWFKAIREGRPEAIVEKLYMKMKNAQMKPVKDDSVEEYLEEGEDQEDKVEEATDNGVREAVELSENTESIVNDLKSKLNDKATEFVSSIVEVVNSVIPKAISTEAVESTKDEVEDVITSDDSDEEFEDVSEEELSETKVSDAEGVPTKLLGVIKEGGSIRVPYKIKSVSVKKTRFGFGKYAIDIVLDKPFDKGAAASISKLISKMYSEADSRYLPKVTVKGDKIRVVLSKKGEGDSSEVEVVDSEESRSVRDAVYSWAMSNSESLATTAIDSEVEIMLEGLLESLKSVDSEFSKEGKSIVYGTDPFIDYRVGMVMVSNNSFIPQVSDTGVQAFSKGFADAAESLYEVYNPTETVESVEEEEVVEDSKSGCKVAYIKDDSGFVIVMTDLHGRDRKYVTETGETKDISEAKRFSDVKEAFHHMMNLSKEGKLTHSIYNSIPMAVADSKEIGELTDEVVDKVLEKVEKDVQERLKDKGIEVSDSVEEDLLKAEQETDTNPTPEQKESGDYRKGECDIQGLTVVIENPKGSVRSGVDSDGKEWSTKMNNTYGYFKGTKSADGDDVDVFIGDNLSSENVFVIDQVNPETGEFDEHKVMLGFDDSESARQAYLSNYEEGWQGLGDITKVNIEAFKEWLNKGSRKKPMTEYIKLTDSMDPNEDKDENIFIGWDREKLKDYYDRLKKKTLSKEERKEFGVYDSVSDEEILLKMEDALNYNIPPKSRVLLKATPHEGGRNRYDMSHTRTTFSEVRDTKEAFNRVLSIASKVVGDSITMDSYQEAVKSDNSTILDAVSESVMTTGDLDLVCPSLYKKKLTDPYWVVDDATDLEESFNVEIPEGMLGKPAAVYSNTPAIGDEFVKGGDREVVVYPLSEGVNLYVISIDEE
mgnify:CR=1 FL=1